MTGLLVITNYQRERADTYSKARDQQNTYCTAWQAIPRVRVGETYH
jgi:hypothetical protein